MGVHPAALALLDHLGIDRFHVAGMCIGGPYIMGLIQAAPQRVFEATHFGRDPYPALHPRAALGRPAAPYAILDFANRQTLRDRFAREVGHDARIFQSEQGARMTDRELRVVQHLQNRFRELEEAQRVRDGRAVAADRVSHVLLRQLELRDQSLIAPRFIDRRQIVPLQVLDQGQREKRTVVSFPLYGGNAFPAQLLAGTQAALSRDQLECAISVRGFTHDDRL